MTHAAVQPNASHFGSAETGLSTVLALAARGWRLFPVAPRAKIPLVKDWRSRATSDPDTLQAWSLQYPGCNWGLACGPGSGVWVLDVDGEEGETSLRSLYVGRDHEWEETLVVKTARGRHIYYRWNYSARLHP